MEALEAEQGSESPCTASKGRETRLEHPRLSTWATFESGRMLSKVEAWMVGASKLSGVGLLSVLNSGRPEPVKAYELEFLKLSFFSF